MTGHRIEILIFSPGPQDVQGVPRGFTLVDQYFSASSAKDPISTEQQLLEGLQKTLVYLVKRYPRRLTVQWVSPWSLGGLWVSVRYRIRTFPTVIIDHRHILVGEQIDGLADRVAEILSQVPTSADDH